MAKKSKEKKNTPELTKQERAQLRQFRVIRIIAFICIAIGIIGFVVAELVLPSEVDESLFFCEPFEPQWVQVMPDGTRKPVDVEDRLEGEPGETFTIETKVTDDLGTYGYFCIKSARQELRILRKWRLRLLRILQRQRQKLL